MITVLQVVAFEKLAKVKDQLAATNGEVTYNYLKEQYTGSAQYQDVVTWLNGALFGWCQMSSKLTLTPYAYLGKHRSWSPSLDAEIFSRDEMQDKSVSEFTSLRPLYLGKEEVLPVCI